MGGDDLVDGGCLAGFEEGKEGHQVLVERVVWHVIIL